MNTLPREVKAIVNSRLLTVESMTDGTTESAISSSSLLTMNANNVMPPPGSFGQPDLYRKSRWNRIQHIANEFLELMEEGISLFKVKVEQTKT